MQKLISLRHSIFISVIMLISLIMSPSARLTESSYGPIQSGDRLWNIATQLRPNSAISRYQVMLALLKANPHAFRIPCNLNTLKTGEMLTVPSLTDMQLLTPHQAQEEFNRQYQQWRTYRRQRQAISCPPPEDTKAPVPETEATTINPIIPTASVATSVSPMARNNIMDEPMTHFILTDSASSTVPSSSSATIPWWDSLLSWLPFITKEQVLTWWSTPWMLPLLISLLVSGIIIVVFIRQWRRNHVTPRQSVTTKDKEQLSSEPLMTTSELKEPHDEVKLSDIPSFSTTEEPTIKTKIEPSLSDSQPHHDEMKEKLDTVRSYLAEDGEQFIQKTLREVIQQGNPEQQAEARQLYEISKKLNYLNQGKKPYLPLAQPNTTDHSLWQDVKDLEQHLALQKFVPEDKEKFFDLVDKIFELFDYELNTQGKLMDAYLNRHNPGQVEINNYAVMEKKSVGTFEDQRQEETLSKPRSAPTPTRRL